MRMPDSRIQRGYINIISKERKIIMVKFNGCEVEDDHMETILRLALDQALMMRSNAYSELVNAQYEGICRRNVRAFQDEKRAQQNIDFYDEIIELVMKIGRNL